MSKAKRKGLNRHRLVVSSSKKKGEQPKLAKLTIVTHGVDAVIVTREREAIKLLVCGLNLSKGYILPQVTGGSYQNNTLSGAPRQVRNDPRIKSNKIHSGRSAEKKKSDLIAS